MATIDNQNLPIEALGCTAAIDRYLQALSAGDLHGVLAVLEDVTSCPSVVWLADEVNTVMYLGCEDSLPEPQRQVLALCERAFYGLPLRDDAQHPISSITPADRRAILAGIRTGAV